MAPTENAEDNDQEGPFGIPDGARASLNGNFVTFPSEAQGLSTRPNDFRARIIVGRKGAGKTLYLSIPTHLARRNGIAVGQRARVSLLLEGIHLMPWEDLREPAILVA